MQRRSLLVVEAAYTEGIAQIEAVVSPWQSRVGNGKLVGKFGDRAEQLLSSVRNAFSVRTKGVLTVRDRADRSRQLEEYFLAVISELFRQQLSILQGKSMSGFRNELIKLARREQGSTADEVQQALRKTLFDLRVAATELEIESMGLSATSIQAEASTSLQALSTEFPETAAAKLEEVKKIEKQAKRPNKKKNERAVNIGLNLVGMLRPPGFGNLQGFVGYSTAFLGLPLDLLLGVQNDGDSPEVRFVCLQQKMESIHTPLLLIC